MNRYLPLVVAMGLLMTLVACNGSGTDGPVTIVPDHATLAPGGSVLFAATAPGVNAKGLTWSADRGWLASDGARAAFVAPSAAGSYHIRVSLAADPSKGTQATVEVEDAAPTSQQSQTIPATGGSLTSTDGAEVYLDGAAVTGSTDIELSTYDTPAAEYRDGVAMAGRRAVVRVASASLADAGTIEVYVPPSMVSSTTLRTAVEASVQLDDGTDASLVLPYRPDTRDGATATIPIVWLRQVFDPDPMPDTLVLTVQPVDVSAMPGLAQPTNNLLSTQSSTALGLYTFTTSISESEMVKACDDADHQRFPSGVMRQYGQADTGKTPLVLVHGWQVLGHYGARGQSIWDRTKRLLRKDADVLISGDPLAFVPAVCDWRDFIEHYGTTAGLNQGYELFTFQYDSDDSIERNAELLADSIEGTFGDRDDVVLMGHSMGGMVINDAMLKGGINDNVEGVVTLGTPFRGVGALSCHEESAGKCSYAVPNRQMFLTNINADILPYYLTVRGVMNVIALAANQQGTRDASWDTALDADSIPNPYLQALTAAPTNPVYAKFRAFYGDLLARASDNWLFQAFATVNANAGFTTDGLVPLQSGAYGVGPNHKIAEVYYKPGLDHSALHNHENFADADGTPGMDTVLTSFLPAADPTITSFDATPATVTEGDAVTLSWAASAPAADAYSCVVDPDPNATGDELDPAACLGSRSVDVSYAKAGTYYPAITIVGDRGGEAHASTIITVEAASTSSKPEAHLAVNPAQTIVGATVRLDASASFDPDGGTIDSYRFRPGDGRNATRSTPTWDISYGAADDYTACVTVVDDEGKSDEACQPVSVTEPTSGDLPNLVINQYYLNGISYAGTGVTSLNLDADEALDIRVRWSNETGAAALPSGVDLRTGFYLDGARVKRDQNDAPLRTTDEATAHFDGGEIPTGTHALSIRLDYENVIEESDETDNTRSITLKVQPPPNQAPNAAFTFATSGRTVSFLDESTDPNGSADIDTWSWAFDDGTGSPLRSPQHAYATSGTYHPSLTVTDAGGLSDTVTHTVSIEAPRITSFTATPSMVDQGATSTLTWSVTGTQPIDLSIDHGVGDVTGSASVRVTPDQTTVYTLTAHSEAGEDTSTATVTVNAPQAPEIVDPVFSGDGDAGTVFTWAATIRDGDSALNDITASVGIYRDTNGTLEREIDMTPTVADGDLSQGVPFQASATIDPSSTTTYYYRIILSDGALGARFPTTGYRSFTVTKQPTNAHFPEFLSVTGPTAATSGSTFTWVAKIRDLDDPPAPSIDAYVQVYELRSTGSYVQVGYRNLSPTTSGGSLATGVFFDGSLRATSSPGTLYYKIYVSDGEKGAVYPTSGGYASFTVN